MDKIQQNNREAHSCLSCPAAVKKVEISY